MRLRFDDWRTNLKVSRLVYKLRQRKKLRRLDTLKTLNRFGGFDSGKVLTR